MTGMLIHGASSNSDLVQQTRTQRTMTQPCKVTTTHKKNSTNVYYSQPANLQIADKTIENVKYYTTHNYKDAETNNGKIYEILTNDNRKICLYTGDNKFLRSSEFFYNKDKLNIGGRVYEGDIVKRTFANNKQVYEITNKLGFIKKVVVNPDGSVVLPKLNILEKIAKFLKK